MSSLIERRRFNSLLAQISVGAYAATQNRSLLSDEITQDRLQPNITSGVSSGDVTHTAATIWSRADRAAKMIVEMLPDKKRARQASIHTALTWL